MIYVWKSFFLTAYCFIVFEHGVWYGLDLVYYQEHLIRQPRLGLSFSGSICLYTL